MRNTWFGWVVLCALATILGCRVPSPDWNGTWKVSPSKSNFQGPLISISISADGEYRYNDGVTNSTFRCDGKYRPLGNQSQTGLREKQRHDFRNDPRGKTGPRQCVSLGASNRRESFHIDGDRISSEWPRCYSSDYRLKNVGFR